MEKFLYYRGPPLLSLFLLLNGRQRGPRTEIPVFRRLKEGLSRLREPRPPAFFSIALSRGSFLDLIRFTIISRSLSEKKSIVILPPFSRLFICTRVPRVSVRFSSRAMISASNILSFFARGPGQCAWPLLPPRVRSFFSAKFRQKVFLLFQSIRKHHKRP